MAVVLIGDGRRPTELSRRIRDGYEKSIEAQ
jgi:hypothetical protein